MPDPIRCIRCGEQIMEGQDYWHTEGGPRHMSREDCREAAEGSHLESRDDYQERSRTSP